MFDEVVAVPYCSVHTTRIVRAVSDENVRVEGQTRHQTRHQTLDTRTDIRLPQTHQTPDIRHHNKTSILRYCIVRHVDSHQIKTRGGGWAYAHSIFAITSAGRTGVRRSNIFADEHRSASPALLSSPINMSELASLSSVSSLAPVKRRIRFPTAQHAPAGYAHFPLRRMGHASSCRHRRHPRHSMQANYYEIARPIVQMQRVGDRGKGPDTHPQQSRHHIPKPQHPPSTTAARLTPTHKYQRVHLLHLDEHVT